MAIEYKTILFTSNLSTASRTAFRHALVLANQFDAKLILLHVMERSPSNYESYMIGLFGQERLQQVLKNNTEEAKHALVGKVTPKQMARTALSEFSRENETDEENIVIPPSQIVVKEGDVVEIILEQAAENNVLRRQGNRFLPVTPPVVTAPLTRPASACLEQRTDCPFRSRPCRTRSPPARTAGAPARRGPAGEATACCGPAR